MTNIPPPAYSPSNNNNNSSNNNIDRLRLNLSTEHIFNANEALNTSNGQVPASSTFFLFFPRVRKKS